jgi:hypothetical protein
MQKCLGSILAAFLFAVPPALALAQSSATSASNPQAVALATQAMAALVGKTPVSDVTLTGTATRTVASDISGGTISLKALGPSLSRMDLALSDGSRSEIRNLATNTPQGFWITPDGTTHTMAGHNCVTDAVWFFPAFSALSQLSNPNLVVTYVGAETRNGVAVQHLHFALQFLTDTTATLQRLSGEDFYLSASSYLPLAVVFNLHPDNDDLTDIPVEIDFGQYQVIGGVQIPYQIEELLNGTPYLNITIQSAVLNSGLSQGDFSAQ